MLEVIPVEYVKLEDTIVYLDINPNGLIEKEEALMKFLEGAGITETNIDNFFNLTTKEDEEKCIIKSDKKPLIFAKDHEYYNAAYDMLWEMSQEITNKVVAILVNRFKLNKIEKGYLYIDPNGEGIGLLNGRTGERENAITTCLLCEILYAILTNEELRECNSPFVSYYYLSDENIVMPVFHRGLYNYYCNVLTAETIIDDNFIGMLIMSINEVVEYSFAYYRYDYITSNEIIRSKQFQNIGYHRFN